MNNRNHNSLSNKLQQAVAIHSSGDLVKAALLYRTILKEAPDTVTALTNLGSILRQQGNSDEAISLLERAIAIPGSNEHAAYNLGNAYRAAGDHHKALKAFRLAVKRNPGWALALCNLGVVHADMGETDEAERCLRSSLVLDPKLELARKNLAGLISSKIMSMQYQVVEDESILVNLAREYGSLSPQAASLPIRQSRNRLPLRAGFISPDLCDHPVGLFLLPVLQQIDHARIKPILYSTGGREDTTRSALRKVAEWRDVSVMDDTSLLKFLREEALNILIDLSGHTAGHRLAVFAARAAPVQISWLGYFATTGVPAMDAVLMDEQHVPPGNEGQFTEKVIRLPYSRFCYQPVSFAPQVKPAPCLTNGYISFGSFNNTFKYQQGVMALWARILAAVPDSRLILKWRDFSDPAECERIRRVFVSHRISADRIEFRPFSFHADLLKEYADIDIALDPFPFTGGHTSCEALWMGVPVITWPQTRAVSRQTYNFLVMIGLQELAAVDSESYLKIAIELAYNQQRLCYLRETLRSKMQSSPLCDVARFARDFEDALLREW